MKIDSNDFNSINKIISSSKNTQKKNILLNKEIINNGYSSLKQKGLNNTIGILQLAAQTIKNITDNNTISLEQAKIELNNATFLGNKIFAPHTILQDDYNNTLFDANRILNLIPNDEKDLYSFKKVLKNEYDFINASLESIKSNIDIIDYKQQNLENYLIQNAILFSKAHNIKTLASKIDSLLA
ncbi:hypothetical protein [Helicobacter sp. MIT 14-3879]|uniref:hypothetical protein n=1 Tax=Helicobacter sp. MIT 14-3879 TaxID=2040649 RepID=UPI000E1E2C5A|nr:hypothetical protein [Helicobacter sp. MIT 14-3879]RDU65213.1 hypothetical protein CQA44_02550 [Helicobacter sp. MIT 14-3879]